MVIGATNSQDHLEEGFELKDMSKLGGTQADEHDMRMLGRTQVLNVCSLIVPEWITAEC